MSTIREVARRAGVSISTVSRVVNGTQFVSSKIEEQVQKAIDELSYKPNAFARGLRVSQSGSIGILLPSLGDVFFSQFALFVERSLYKNGYLPFFCNIENSVEKEARYIQILLQQQVDAVIIVPSIQLNSSVANVRLLIKRKIPVVTVERSLPGLDTSHVLVDNFGGGYLGAKYLLEQGHQQIGIMVSSSDQIVDSFSPMVERLRGIRAAFKNRGLEDNLVLQYEDEPTKIGFGYQGSTNLIQKFPNLTAIFALSDRVAVGVYHALYDLGLSIPQDISVLGFDNIPIASHIVPLLTTIAQPIEQIAEQATELLLHHINDPTMKTKSITLKTELIERKSVKNLNSSSFLGSKCLVKAI